MKRNIVLLMVVILGAMLSPALYGQIDNLTNMSAEWVRMSNRNAAIDAADIVVYNPAGLTKLRNGFHLNLSNQLMIRKPEHTYDLGMGPLTFGQDAIDAVLPNVFAAFKKNNWALFAGVYIPGGGAVADYPNGSITTQLIGYRVMAGFAGIFDSFINESFKASSVYFTTTLGGAYALNDTVSVAAGLRYMMVKNSVVGKMSFHSSHYATTTRDLDMRLDAEDTASGAGAVFGLNISPGEKLNIGLRYETKVKLDFETKITKDDFQGTIMRDGDKNRRDFPAMFGLGISYKVTPKIRVETDFNYFFQENADWGLTMSSAGPVNYSELAGNCYSLGAAMAYEATRKLELSGGFLYTKTRFTDMDTYYTNLGAFEVLYSDNMNLGVGVGYSLKKNVRFNAGLSVTLWKDETVKALAFYPMDVDVATTNSTYTFALGFNIGGQRR
ncbi:MAG: hypothetical protein GY765_25380 [bacterium]|nr:hypothetical protein [bacterium]